MLTQIYEVSTPQEASILSGLGVDHIGILVGDGAFPREQSLSAASAILAAIKLPSKVSALFLSANLDLIVEMGQALAPDIIHLGASAELLSPCHTRRVKDRFPNTLIMRSIPVLGEEAVPLATSYDGVADFLLLDTHKLGDKQIGALGVTHDWDISERIVHAVNARVILAGGLGPENVVDAIRKVRPAGVDSKTKTDVTGTHIKDIERVRSFVGAAKGSMLI